VTSETSGQEFDELVLRYRRIIQDHSWAVFMILFFEVVRNG
jgi:hypothetical protein